MDQSQRVKAILLDVGGTLIECRPSAPEVYAATLSRWGPPVQGAQVEPAFRSAWEDLTQVHPPGLDRYHSVKGGEREWWGALLRRVLAALDHPAPWEPVLDELFEAFSAPDLWHVFPEVDDVLRELRRRGLRLAAVSNWDSRLPALLDRLQLLGKLDAVVVSSLEGIEKPAPEIFHRALRRIGVAPGDCLHAGDSPLDDVRGAESAGLRAVLVDRDWRFEGGYDRIPDLRGLYDYL